MVGYLDAFYMTAWTAALTVPLVLLVGRRR
jgi:hypothetical protein